jgi:hypothetical protein
MISISQWMDIFIDSVAINKRETNEGMQLTG